MKALRQFRRATLWIVLIFGILIPLGSFASCIALDGTQMHGMSGSQTVTNNASLVFLCSLGFAVIQVTAWTIAEVFFRRRP